MAIRGEAGRQGVRMVSYNDPGCQRVRVGVGGRDRIHRVRIDEWGKGVTRGDAGCQGKTGSMFGAIEMVGQV